MALLWTRVAAQQREAMAWYDDKTIPRNQNRPVSVRKAGFKGYVGGGYDDDFEDHDDEHGGFDEDAWDEARPEPTRKEQAHYEKHGDYPDDYYERHDQAYSQALDAKARENDPDLEDEELHTFVAHHGAEPHLWQSKGHLGKVDISGGVYATQSHVNQFHVDRYLRDPGARSWNDTQGAPTGGDDPNRYLGHDHPMFVTHEGRLHATEGHHRVAAALQRGDKHIYGWHYDGDRHGLPGDPDEDY